MDVVDSVNILLNYSFWVSHSHHNHRAILQSVHDSVVVAVDNYLCVDVICLSFVYGEYAASVVMHCCMDVGEC